MKCKTKGSHHEGGHSADRSRFVEYIDEATIAFGGPVELSDDGDPKALLELGPHVPAQPVTEAQPHDMLLLTCILNKYRKGIQFVTSLMWYL